MLAKVISNAVLGIKGYLIEVEIDIAKGLPSFSIVGLPDKAVKEARERVRAAIKNSGFKFPIKKITVNLAPAGIKKEGAIFDLPIASGILAAEGLIKQQRLNDYLLVGELSLDGRVKGVNGALIMAGAAKKSAQKGILIPQENYQEAAVISGIEIIPVSSLKEVVQFLNHGQKKSLTQTKASSIDCEQKFSIDYSEVKGQQTAKRALEIAAAGRHNLIMLGPPGAGKTMLARRLPTILPKLSQAEAIEVSKIFSTTGRLDKSQGLITKRQFRSPHHSISRAALVGGGRIPKPGEISLAHHGVLFLDELAEFKRDSLEALRQPLEAGEITITRSALSLSYPADVVLLASSNLCPCGLLGAKAGSCNCSSSKIRQYQQKLSGPLMDRIDIHLKLAPLTPEELVTEKDYEASKSIKQRVIQAQNLQLERYKAEKFNYNAMISSDKLKDYCQLTDENMIFLKRILSKLNLSARAYNKILKLARTIADLELNTQVSNKHIAEAVQYRDLDRQKGSIFNYS